VELAPGCRTFLLEGFDLFGLRITTEVQSISDGQGLLGRTSWASPCCSWTGRQGRSGSAADGRRQAQCARRWLIAAAGAALDASSV